MAYDTTMGEPSEIGRTPEPGIGAADRRGRLRCIGVSDASNPRTTGELPTVHVSPPGVLYLPGSNDNGAVYLRGQELLERFNLSRADDSDGRRDVLGRLLGAIGDGSEVRPTLICDYGANVFLGSRVYINAGCSLLDVAAIVIGDDTQLGPGVQILTANHPLDTELRRQKWESAEPVTLGSNVWIGAGAIIVPGKTIGDNTVVGAGSVVTKDLPPNVLAVGSPARVIRDLN